MRIETVPGLKEKISPCQLRLYSAKKTENLHIWFGQGIITQICEADGTSMQFDQAFLFHKWVLTSVSEEAKQVRQVGEVAGGRWGGQHKASYDEWFSCI